MNPLPPISPPQPERDRSLLGPMIAGAAAALAAHAALSPDSLVAIFFLAFLP